MNEITRPLSTSCESLGQEFENYQKELLQIMFELQD